MNFVLFTPITAHSAIGRMAGLTVKTLSTCGHQVVVIRTEHEARHYSPTHDFNVPIVSWSDTNAVLAAAQEADALVYQIGDNHEYHQGAVEWLYKLPGIVCLHDFFVGHLFYAWAQQHRSQAYDLLEKWYCEDVARTFFTYSSSEEFISATHSNAPMTEWICSMASGVLTHSSWGAARVLQSCPGPVRVAALPYDAPLIDASNLIKDAVQDDKFNVLTIGHVNPNKRARVVIDAIADSELLRPRTVYHLVGAIREEMENELSNFASKQNVELKIHGEVDSSSLIAQIKRAHVISCLRSPSLEAASASAIEAMLYGKAILVTDHGFYAEIPSSCAYKIQPAKERESVREALEALYQNEDERIAMGSRAESWAAQTFTANRYVTQLCSIADEIVRSSPALTPVHRFAHILLNWKASVQVMGLESTTDPLQIFSKFS